VRDPADVAAVVAVLAADAVALRSLRYRDRAVAIQVDGLALDSCGVGIGDDLAGLAAVIDAVAVHVDVGSHQAGRGRAGSAYGTGGEPDDEQRPTRTQIGVSREARRAWSTRPFSFPRSKGGPVMDRSIRTP
jgi:hypothetical protein